MSGTLHAHHEKPNGAAAVGDITITVNTEKQVIRDPVGNVVFQGPLTITLVEGEATFTLPASDDDTLSPTGFTYTVTEKLKHVAKDNYRTADFQITDGQTLHTADLVGDDEAALDPSYGANLSGALTEIDALRAGGDATFEARLSASYAQATNVFPTVSHGIGSGNDTTYVQAKLDALSPALGLDTLVLRGGTWMIDGVNTAQPVTKDRAIGGGLVPKSGTTLVLEGATINVITNGSPGYAAISLDAGQDNVTIRGGTIHGDRATHDYATEPTYTTHEWGVGIYARACTGLVVDGVTITGMTGDCIKLVSVGLDKTLPDYDPVRNATIQNCVLDGARRNNISVTGADFVLIENNQITRAGYDDGIHAGTNPKIGIDLESDDLNREVRRVTIRGNNFEGNTVASMDLYNSLDTLVESNVSDAPLAFGVDAKRATVRGNIFYAATPVTIPAMSGGAGATDFVIEGNYISGFAKGIEAKWTNTSVRGNTVTRFTEAGITATSGPGLDITGNTVYGDKTSTTQIGIYLGGSTDTRVDGNTVNGSYYGIRASVIAGVGTYFITNNTLIDCFDSVRGGIAATMQVSGNTFRPGGHGSGIGTDVIWTNVVAMIAMYNTHYDSNIAYNGASDGTLRNRISKNTIIGCTGVTAIQGTGTGGIFVVEDNTVNHNRATAVSQSCAITATGAGSRVTGNTFSNSGAGAVVCSVKTSAASSSIIARNVMPSGVSPILPATTDTLIDNTTVGGTVLAKSSSYTALCTDKIIFGTGGGGGITITLPSVSNAGVQLTVKKVDVGAGSVTVAGTIDGVTNKVLAAQYDKVTVVSNGTAWFIVA